jgi:hypothetical protein
LADLEHEYHYAIESGDNQRVRAVVVELTTRIQNELVMLSVNAPNWYALVLSVLYPLIFMDISRDVLHSAEIARRILWTGRDVPLEDFAAITSA